MFKFLMENNLEESEWLRILQSFAIRFCEILCDQGQRKAPISAEISSCRSRSCGFCRSAAMSLLHLWQVDFPQDIPESSRWFAAANDDILQPLSGVSIAPAASGRPGLAELLGGKLPKEEAQKPEHS